MIVHRPNYHTTHMLQSVRQHAVVVSYKSKDAAVEVMRVLECFRDATKFVCPMNGLFFEDTKFPRYLEMLRLPYKRVVLEYDAQYGVFDTNAPDELSVTICAQEDDLDGKQGATVFVAYENRAQSGWALMPCWIFIPYGITPEQMKDNCDTAGIMTGYIHSDLHSILLHPKQKMDAEEAAKATATVLFRESLSVLQFCAAMACNNVETERVPAPKSINQRRTAKGHLPLFEYHVLTVDVQHRNEKGEPQGGTHASPRQHLRRGHIRHYKSGLTVWIQPMTVGRAEDGKIKKDYRIKTWGQQKEKA